LLEFYILKRQIYKQEMVKTSLGRAAGVAVLVVGEGCVPQKLKWGPAERALRRFDNTLP